MKARLGPRIVDALRPLERSTYDFYDADCPGLVVRVRPSGTKSYLVRLRDPDTRRWYWWTLGRTRDLTVDLARGLAVAARRQMTLAQNGAAVDPRAERRKRRAASEYDKLFGHETDTSNVSSAVPDSPTALPEPEYPWRKP